ncbi:CDP-alcohol phosphatidyltransferase family protein [Streptomyces sp. NPDC059740]|uniref:CDP-alcohol phosphatidyltransferase family protein n=1 Tax=Streptomyces sp. NPDC059740 TaxID=3346926 RepID=UPI0036661767
MARYVTAWRALRTAQKTSRGVSLYSRWVNRPVGRVFAAAAFRLGMTPDQVTAASAVVSLAGVAAVAWFRPAPWLGPVVWAALALGFALDSADGQLARLRGGGSAAGEWLDHVVDCVKTVTLHAAVAVSLLRFPVDGRWPLDGRWPVVLPFCFQTAAVTVFFGGVLRELLGRRAAPAPPAGPPSRVRALALLPVDFGVVALAFVTLGWPGVFTVVYGLLAVAHLLFLVAFLAKWYRELSQAG